jgi:hypothetical protein
MFMFIWYMFSAESSCLFYKLHSMVLSIVLIGPEQFIPVEL